MTFETYTKVFEKQINGIYEYNELTRNSVTSCENFIEKYQPLFLQRLINEALDYVLTSQTQKARCKTYGKVKQEFYTKGILEDKGFPNLQKRAKMMKNSLTTGLPLQEEVQV